MIHGYLNDHGRLRPAQNPMDQLEELVWIDLVAPTPEEEALLEHRLGMNVPTRAEMEEIEISSRLYTDEGVSFMTASLLAQTDSQEPQMDPVSFVLHPGRLLTVRYHEPRAFRTFPVRGERVPVGAERAETLLVALLEAIVDRMADVLERNGNDIERLSREVFRRYPGATAGRSDFQQLLIDIGRSGDLTSNARSSLGSLERLVMFLAQGMVHRHSSDELRGDVDTLGRDVRSLIDHAAFLSQKINFLLDATLGMITIEQNAIVKIFSIAAVVFLPPTLIASVYGMNFHHMPELDWLFGYPFALLLMVASAALSYWYFKRRRWL